MPRPPLCGPSLFRFVAPPVAQLCRPLCRNDTPAAACLQAPSLFPGAVTALSFTAAHAVSWLAGITRSAQSPMLATS
jgi:hypothetical protein